MIQIGLFNLLKTIPSVGSKIYPLVATQTCNTPYIVYQRVGKSDTSTMEGTESLDIGRFQIKVYTKTYMEGLLLANKVKEKLNGKGTLVMHVDDQEADTKLFFQILDYKLSDDILF
jgi:hypothetical protein